MRYLPAILGLTACRTAGGQHHLRSSFNRATIILSSAISGTAATGQALDQPGYCRPVLRPPRVGRSG